jgi:hypothetical protein
MIICTACKRRTVKNEDLCINCLEEAAEEEAAEEENEECECGCGRLLRNCIYD